MPTPEATDWRLPENRREGFQRFYAHHLRYRTHPGCVYQMLPAIAEHYGLDDDQRAWLVWLNGNTQNAVTSLLLFRAAPTPDDWPKAVDFWNANFKALEWDTDRRHQKSKFGEATEKWAHGWAGGRSPAEGWYTAGLGGWDTTWSYSKGQPYMGRLSAWSMAEYARILLGPDIPDAATFMMDDKAGSKSHRNGAALVAGYDSVYWDAGDPFMLGIVDEIDGFAESLLAEAEDRAVGTDWRDDVTRLTLESALCTYKSFYKPNRRYPNVYADMFYNRIRKAEARFPGEDFSLLWDTRRNYLPAELRLEDSPHDPGMVPVKQNHFRETGEIINLHAEWPDMANGFNLAVEHELHGRRKDPTWKL